MTIKKRFDEASRYAMIIIIGMYIAQKIMTGLNIKSHSLFIIDDKMIVYALCYIGSYVAVLGLMDHYYIE